MDKIMLHQELTGKILEAAFEVSKELDAGFLESVYERSLQVALIQKGLTVTLQTPLSVKFRGITVGDFYADMIVDGKGLIELKAVNRILNDTRLRLLII